MRFLRDSRRVIRQEEFGALVANIALIFLLTTR